ncbi:MAG: hypothetical protein H0W65_11895 [Sphingomonas sp.]|uniref:hypothetical protein n=1 Tax=Sphingomonas sp. TaxID=28214 RepID=UPI0017E57C68|nr:hypothetical protein [Sphingomonas sp.]MBA3668400.1 hypothetical protein [Sphingomonas sp.]
MLAFLSLNFRPDHPPEYKGGTLSTFDLANDAEDAPAKTAQKQATVTKQPPRPIPPMPTPPIPKPAIRLPDRPLPMLIVSKEVYAASDIAKLGKPATDSGAEVASSGSSPGDSARVGTGPHGEPLYAAEWYREPTNQELSTYLPRTMPEGGGWGVIACKTIDRFHVADCVELGQGPAGSHLASAARQAAWQFLVRPPRVGGKVLVGEWVRIRIDYHVSSADAPSE